MNLFIVLMAEHVTKFSNYRKECMQSFNIKRPKNHITNHGLTLQ